MVLFSKQLVNSKLSFPNFLSMAMLVRPESRLSWSARPEGLRYSRTPVPVPRAPPPPTPCSEGPVTCCITLGLCIDGLSALFFIFFIISFCPSLVLCRRSCGSEVSPLTGSCPKAESQLCLAETQTSPVLRAPEVFFSWTSPPPPPPVHFCVMKPSVR